MRSLCAALLACSLALTTGCIGGIGIPGLGADPVAQHIDSMKSNAMVMYYVNFHASPKVGQFAVIKDGLGETWYGIVGGKAGAWEVEKRYTVPGSDKKAALLMIVDDKGLVSKAYAAPYDAEAKEKPEAVEVKVMEKPKPQKAGEAAKGPEPKWSKEKVGDVETDKMELDKVIIWYSKTALFAAYLDTETPDPHGGMLKMSYDGKVSSELIKSGEGKFESSMKMKP